MSAARQIASVPAAGARVVSLDEWRACRRGAVADAAAPPALRLVTDADTPSQFRLDVFLRRARLVMGEPPTVLTRLDTYPDAEPA